MAYIGMARHSTSAFNECSATRMLAERLESSGKIKTFATMVSLCVMMLLGESWFPAPDVVAVVCWCIILVTTVYSGIEYFVKNIGVFHHAP